MIEITGELLMVSACLLLWLGRMSKRPKDKHSTIFVDREKVVEKKIEVPTTVYKCQHDCVIKLAEKLYSQVSVNDWSAESSDEQAEMEQKHAETMERCFKIAFNTHPPIPAIHSRQPAFQNGLES